MRKTFSIGSIPIGPGNPILIVAEAGVNHNGDIEIAKMLVRSAKACGANCVKFQTYRADRLILKDAPKAEYQLKTTDPAETQMEMLQKLELPEEAYPDLIRLCQDEGLVFLSTPYNTEDVDFLSQLNVPAFKIASGQITEPDFLEHIAREGKPLILSTGMCTLAEVDEAIRVIRQCGNSQMVLLQCTTNYPSRIEDSNLRAMKTMQCAFDTLVGYSDHTNSLTAAIVSVGMGACVIERHFTLDKSMVGPDHSCSSDPGEFALLVNVIREAEMCLGSGKKEPTLAELRNARGMRRSLVSRRAISSGESLTRDNLILKRPGTGIPGKLAHFICGRPATMDIPAETMITWKMVG